MRGWMVKCLDDGKIAPCPLNEEMTKNIDRYTKPGPPQASFDILCSCRMPLEPAEKTFRCQNSLCGVKNFHLMCVTPCCKKYCSYPCMLFAEVSACSQLSSV